MASDIKKLHADFLEDLEIGQGRSAKTVENYNRYLKRFYKEQNITSIASITPETVRSFRRWLNESAPKQQNTADLGVSLATQNYYLIALRQFLKYLTKRDIEVLSPDKVGLAKLGERNIDVLYPEEMDALLEAVSPEVQSVEEKVDPAKLRDAAILEVLYSTGMRVAELVSLDRDDIREDNNELAIRGKGNKVRVVFLSPTAREAIQAYLVIRGDIDPALFVQHSANASGSSNLRITPRSVQRLIKKYAAMAGLTKTVTPHTLRHSFATDLLSNGADVRQVQQLLGHASITTTQVYTHLTDIHLKDVHEKYHRKNSSS
jgi:site-specific recombinase XerD